MNELQMIAMLPNISIAIDVIVLQLVLNIEEIISFFITNTALPVVPTYKVPLNSRYIWLC
jgi:hypothetical protein